MTAVMSTTNLIILVGIPGCGKSTWAERMFDPFCYETISSDAIRAELSNINDQSRNSEVFEIFHSRIHDALCDGLSVIADSTALDQRSRRNLVDIASAVGVDGVHLIYFSNCDQAIRRNLVRERRVPDDVMTRMLNKYEKFRLDLPHEQQIGWYSMVTEIRRTS